MIACPERSPRGPNRPFAFQFWHFWQFWQSSELLENYYAENAAVLPAHPGRRFRSIATTFSATARPDQTANALRCRLRAFGYRVALGVSAGYPRISLQDHAQQLCAVSKVPALHLQFQRCQSLSPDEGVLSRRLRKAQALCRRRALVSRRLF